MLNIFQKLKVCTSYQISNINYFLQRSVSIYITSKNYFIQLDYDKSMLPSARCVSCECQANYACYCFDIEASSKQKTEKRRFVKSGKALIKRLFIIEVMDCIHLCAWFYNNIACKNIYLKRTRLFVCIGSTNSWYVNQPK